jgi:hypothetical protein
MTTNVGKVGLYLVNGTAGKVGTPGASILHFSLLVNAVTGSVTGHARQTQAVQGPASDIPIVITHGHIQATGFGKYTKIVALYGNGMISLPPPAIGTFLVPFAASFAIDDKWDGEGGWTLGGHSVQNVPVKHD